MKQHLKTLAVTVIATILTLFFALALVGPKLEISPLEVLAVAVTYASVWLSIERSRITYPVGILGVVLYSILMWQWGLYALSLFNIYLVASLTYGYYRWGPDGKESLPITNVESKASWMNYGLFGFGLVVLLYGIINTMKHFGMEIGSIQATDIIAASLSGVAQLLMDNKKKQTFYVWGAVNVFSIYVYVGSEGYLAAIQYSFLLLNVLYGIHVWNKAYHKQSPEKAPVFNGMQAL